MIITLEYVIKARMIVYLWFLLPKQWFDVSLAMVIDVVNCHSVTPVLHSTNGIIPCARTDPFGMCSDELKGTEETFRLPISTCASEMWYVFHRTWILRSYGILHAEPEEVTLTTENKEQPRSQSFIDEIPKRYLRRGDHTCNISSAVRSYDDEWWRTLEWANTCQ